MELAPRLSDPKCSYRGANHAECEAGPAEHFGDYVNLGHDCPWSQPAFFFGCLSLVHWAAEVV